LQNKTEQTIDDCPLDLGGALKINGCYAVGRGIPPFPFVGRLGAFRFMAPANNQVGVS